jgi:inner membrane protein
MWMVAGFAMLATETIVPGFFLLFFGMGAVFMGFFQLVFPGVPLWIELLIFLAVSTLWLGLFRRRLIAYMHKQTPPKKVDEIAGEMAVALETIAPGQIGKAELRGATWNALNLGDRAIEASVRCRVDRVQGLTLEVRPM